MSSHKIPVPERTSVVCPYLIVNSVEKQIDFLREVFNAEVGESVKQPDGQVMHGEVRIGDTTIMMGKANEKFPAMQNMNYVFVQNADKTYGKAIDYGAEHLMEPEDRFYGIREGGVKDVHGNTWWIAQFLEKVSSEELQQKLSEMNQESK